MRPFSQKAKGISGTGKHAFSGGDFPIMTYFPESENVKKWKIDLSGDAGGWGSSPTRSTHHESWTETLAFCHDGKTLVSGGHNSVMTWDLVSSERMVVLQRDNQAFPWDIAGLGIVGLISWSLLWRAARRANDSELLGAPQRLDDCVEM